MKKRKIIPAAQRMQSKFRPNPETGCWEWTGARKSVGGYGQIREGLKNIPAHRVSYEARHGTIPDGLFVLHRCDNPGCVNPDHLFLGTHAENMADRGAKSRQSHGASHPCAKLTEADVIAIRAASGVTSRQLAERFGVHPKYIYQIKMRKKWTKLAEQGA